jgi:hypothetical protein
MSEENKRIARQVLEELFEKGNLEAADELIHPHFVNHEAPPDNPQGPDGLNETVSWLRGIWGPMHADIEDEICNSDKVVARVPCTAGTSASSSAGSRPARNTPPSRSTSRASRTAK